MRYFLVLFFKTPAHWLLLSIEPEHAAPTPIVRALLWCFQGCNPRIQTRYRSKDIYPKSARLLLLPMEAKTSRAFNCARRRELISSDPRNDIFSASSSSAFNRMKSSHRLIPTFRRCLNRGGMASQWKPNHGNCTPFKIASTRTWSLSLNTACTE